MSKKWVISLVVGFVLFAICGFIVASAMKNDE